MRNQTGIVLINNSSIVKNNEILNSLEDGIHVLCKKMAYLDGEKHDCFPTIRYNLLKFNHFNAILVQGEGSNPLIAKNTILENKRCGIKLIENSRAEIVEENLISNNLH